MNESDVTKALDEVRREVIESRNMTIKTDNALKTLHAELKSVSQNQERFEKRTWFATGATYVGFILLSIGAAYFVSNAKASSVTAEKERLDRQVGELNSQLERQRAESTGYAASERAAQEVMKLMNTLNGEERLKGVEAFAKLDQSKMSPFMRQALNDRASQVKLEVGNSMLEKAREALRRKEFQETVALVGRLNGLQGTGGELNEATSLLGQALAQQKKYREAIEPLQRFVDGDKKAKGRDVAMFYLMQSYDATGRPERGLELAREGLATYQQSEVRGGFYFRTQQRPVGAPTASGAAAPTTPAAQ
jgi:tetratricopeptide (TPR) repeat protein